VNDKLAKRGVTMKGIRLAMSPITKEIYAGKIKSNGIEWSGQKTNVTTDFLRCVVMRFSESMEFEVDGMKFRATCERIE
jgi:hypothetical protein